MRSWISELTARRSVPFNPYSIRLDMKLSRTGLNAPAESALVKTMVDGFVRFYIEVRMTPMRKNGEGSVAFKILDVSPVDTLNALHDMPPVYWLTSTEVSLDRRSKRDN
jgi:hypothetical protein